MLVTGADGFVGRALCAHLEAKGIAVRRAVRRRSSAVGAHTVAVGDLGPQTDWEQALLGVDAVVHLAARVHAMRDRAPDPMAEYRRVNVEATRRLAAAAASCGVRRMLLLSSIKVNGDAIPRPFIEADTPAPIGPYAVSKWEAEQALAQVSAQTGLEWVVLRPPLTYGPEVRANFLQLLRAVHRGLPFPLGGVDNRRSLLYVGNLAAAIERCVASPEAARRTFLVSDGEDVSSPELVRRVARALGVKPRLMRVPASALRFAGRVTGRGAAVDRLLGSLQIDGSALLHTLSWRPPFTLDEGLERTARWYLGCVA